MPGRLHEQYVRNLGAIVGGFSTALYDLVAGTVGFGGSVGASKTARREWAKKSILSKLPLPDAYKVISGYGLASIICFEVEISNKLGIERLARYAILARELDTKFGVTLSLMIVDKNEDRREVELVRPYYEELSRELGYRDLKHALFANHNGSIYPETILADPDFLHALRLVKAKDLPKERGISVSSLPLGTPLISKPAKKKKR
jgi:hypothetical protein